MINKLLTILSIYLIRLYQITLSPDKGLPRFWLKWKVCRHEPHCSQYAIEHLQTHWFIKSIIPIMDRVSNCTPGHEIIHDPVPRSSSREDPLGRPQRLKIVFFSSAPIGISFLEQLIDDNRFEIIWIVTQPDQPSGRWLELKENIVKTKGKEYWITEIVTPNTLRLDSKKYPNEWKEFQQWLQNLHPDYIVVIAYGKLIPQHILDIPKIAPINIHWSLLPKYRWASPIQTCLLNGEKESGITIMKMSAWLDEGDIIKQLHIPLEVTTTTKDLINSFSFQGPQFTNQVLRSFANGKEKIVKQDDNKASFTKKMEKEDGLVDIYNEPLEQVIRKYNAYYLRPKIYFMHNGKRVIIEEIEIIYKNYKKYLKYNNTEDEYFSYNLVDKRNNISPTIKKLLVKPEGKKTMTRDSRKIWYLKEQK